MSRTEERYDRLPAGDRISDHMTPGWLLVVTVAALSVETVVLTFVLPLTLMMALGGWCTDWETDDACTAQQHAVDMTYETLAVTTFAIVVVGAYAAVRGIGGAPTVRIPRGVAAGLALSFGALLPVAAIGCAVAIGGPDDVPHLWHAVALIWSLLLLAWTVVLHRTGARCSVRRRGHAPVGEVQGAGHNVEGDAA